MKSVPFVRLLVMVFIAVLISSIVIQAQTTAFNYQGNLTDSSASASGTYDFEFALYDATGTLIASNSTSTTGVTVTNGVFTVKLDFGSTAFTGADRYLEIRVKKPTDSNYTPLSPRQQINSAPYAIRSLSAGTADTATNATNATNADKLGNVDSSNFVQTDTTAFIRNQTAQQTNANFNVSGTGTATIFNAATQYNIGGKRILSIPGSFNLFVGIDAGISNTTGDENSFIGKGAGRDNTTGSINSFFGRHAGLKNSSGNENAFFGAYAGEGNGSGSNNSFFGTFAGVFNSQGTNNSFFGNRAGAYSIFNNNSFFGARAGENNAGFDNSFIGAFAGRSNTSGQNNSFVGSGAGYANTMGNNNSFFGKSAGQFTTIGNDNSFFGFSSASQNDTGYENSFFGSETGFFNTTGYKNAFFGWKAGYNNATGYTNSFFGRFAGGNNTDGINNAYFGASTGGAINGSYNSFFGTFAGTGQSSQIYVTSGSYNTLIGSLSALGAENLSYATAIGSEAVVPTSNTIALGRKTGADKVLVPGILQINTLGTNGSIPICRNAAKEISTCSTALALAETNADENAAEIKTMREQIKIQQQEINELKQIVCSIKPDASVCQPTKK